MNLSDPQTIIALITLGTAICAVILFVFKPQAKADKADSLLTQSVNQLQKDFANLRDNHVHTLDTKIDQANDNIQKMALEVTRLATIIDERIPARHRNK